MSRARIAALAVLPLVLLGSAACQDNRDAQPPLTNGTGNSVQQQFDSAESTLNSIESELNDG